MQSRMYRFKFCSDNLPFCGRCRYCRWGLATLEAGYALDGWEENWLAADAHGCCHFCSSFPLLSPKWLLPFPLPMTLTLPLTWPTGVHIAYAAKWKRISPWLSESTPVRMFVVLSAQRTTIGINDLELETRTDSSSSAQSSDITV